MPSYLPNAPNGDSSSRKAIISFFLAWGFLNLFINFNYPAPLASSIFLVLPSLEVWAVLLLLSISARFKIAFSPRLYLPLLLFLLLIRLFRFGDTLMPLYFNRPFNLYMDSRYLPNLLHLLVHSFTTIQVIGITAIGTAALALIGWGLWKSFHLIYHAFGRPRFVSFFWCLTGIQFFLVYGYLNNYYPSNFPPPALTSAMRIGEELSFVFQIEEIKNHNIETIKSASARTPVFKRPLELLGGRNIILFMVESYGHTLYQERKHALRFAARVKAVNHALQQAGFQIYTGLLQSSTFGGASWLAFATLESGVWVPNQIRYNFLLASHVKPLAAYFNQAGYRSISVMPATTMPWPEGAYFSYERAYYAKDFGYTGPPFGWSPMPDQFVLKTIFDKEIQSSKRPLFLRFVLSSTHAPFHNQPRYIEDWERIGDGSIYHELEPVRFPDNWPDLTEATDAYLTAMEYEFEVLQSYLIDYVEDDSLVIIMGDHQPNAHISGPKATDWVPIHVISRNVALLLPFAESGYTSGMVPQKETSFQRMDLFLSFFLKAFSQE
jgi:hypothetical protein